VFGCLISRGHIRISEIPWPIYLELTMQENFTFDDRQAQTLSGVLHAPANGQTRACALFYLHQEQ